MSYQLDSMVSLMFALSVFWQKSEANDGKNKQTKI